MHINFNLSFPNAYLGEGNDNPLQYSCLENSVDRRAWWVTGHGVTKESDMAMYVCTKCKSMFYYLCSKESACNAGDLGLILGLGRSPGEGNGNTLQYSCLENGQKSLVGYSPGRGPKKSDMTKWLTPPFLWDWGQ